MFNDNKNKISFKGIGQLIIDGSKFNPLERGIWETKLWEIAGDFKFKFEGKTKDLINFMIDKGILIDEKTLNLANVPRRFLTAVIRDGKGRFSEDTIQGFHTIKQKGGKLEQPVEARHIVVEGGKNVGVKGYDITVRSAESGPIEAKDNVTIFESTVKGSITSHNNATIMNSNVEDIKVRRFAYVTGSTIDNVKVNLGCLFVSGLPKTTLGSVKAPRMELNTTNVEFQKSLNVSESVDMTNAVSVVTLGKHCRLNKTARQDLYSYNNLYGNVSRMKV